MNVPEEESYSMNNLKKNTGKEIESYLIHDTCGSCSIAPPVPARPDISIKYEHNYKATTEKGRNINIAEADGEPAQQLQLDVLNESLVTSCKQDSSSTVVDGPSEFGESMPENALGGQTDEHILPQRRRCIGKWQLGRTIGEGSSGKVKLAHHADTKEVVRSSITIVCC